MADTEVTRDVRISLTSNDDYEGCILIREKGKPEVLLTYAEVADLAEVRQQTAKAIAQKLRERAEVLRTGDTTIVNLLAEELENRAAEIEREYEVKL